MPKTKTDILTMALQHLGVVGAGEVPTALDYETTGNALDAVLDYLTNEHGLTMPADIDATGDALALRLSRVVAAEVAPSYEVASPLSLARAISGVRSYLISDDREDHRDLDDDGTISDDEVQAGLRALYY